jgi:hypothetical protein
MHGRGAEIGAVGREHRDGRKAIGREIARHRDLVVEQTPPFVAKVDLLVDLDAATLADHGAPVGLRPESRVEQAQLGIVFERDPARPERQADVVAHDLERALLRFRHHPQQRGIDRLRGVRPRDVEDGRGRFRRRIGVRGLGEGGGHQELRSERGSPHEVPQGRLIKP